MMESIRLDQVPPSPLVYAPSNTPIMGLSFAEDGGHAEDLHSLMFDEAAACVLPAFPSALKLDGGRAELEE
jgi:hypothetical protein